MNQSNILKFQTEQQKILKSYEPLTLSISDCENGVTIEDIRQFNVSKLIEIVSSNIMQEYLGDGRDIPLDTFFNFQMTAFKTASALLESCQRIKSNKENNNE